MQEAFGIAEKITGVKAPRLHPSPAMLKAMAGFTSLNPFFSKSRTSSLNFVVE